MSGHGFFERVYAVVREIPSGRVATYGQVAALVGVARGARAVGWALGALDSAREAEVPWHRVVGAGGRIAPRTGHGQRRRLRAEGVRFRGERVDLTHHGLFLPGERGRAGARSSLMNADSVRVGQARARERDPRAPQKAARRGRRSASRAR